MSPEEPTSAPLLAMLDVPGGYVAVAAGCLCSVLANREFRAGEPGAEPLVDPTCPLHGSDSAWADRPAAPDPELPEAG